MATEPISDIIFISNPQSRPSGYFILERTVTGHDGQLFDATWRHKGKRYLCFSKAASPTQGSKVITEMTIITDESKVPTGFSTIQNSKDDNEKPLRKHLFCFKSLPREQAQDAVCDVVLINKGKGEPPPPGYYTVSNTVNELNVCYRVGPVPRYHATPQATYPQYSYASQPHPVQPYRQPQPLQQPQQQQQQWFAHQQPIPQHIWLQQHPPGRPANTTHTQQTEQHKISVLDGIPFEISPQYTLLWKKQEDSLPFIQKLSLDDVQMKFNYSFNTERSITEAR